jgi:hypothetical protein
MCEILDTAAKTQDEKVRKLSILNTASLMSTKMPYHTLTG